jgi:hypothetical protein
MRTLKQSNAVSIGSVVRNVNTIRRARSGRGDAALALASFRPVRINP